MNSRRLKPTAPADSDTAMMQATYLRISTTSRALQRLLILEDDERETTVDADSSLLSESRLGTFLPALRYRDAVFSDLDPVYELREGDAPRRRKTTSVVRLSLGCRTSDTARVADQVALVQARHCVTKQQVLDNADIIS